MNVRSIILFLLLLVLSLPAQAQTMRELYEMAVDAYNQKQFDVSINKYQEILKVAPHFSPAYIGIGLCLRAKGAADEEVIYYYSQAVQNDPTNLQALEQLGRLYFGLNQYTKAEKVFLRCLKIKSDMPQVRQALGWINLMAKSKPELAVKYFRSALNQEDKSEALYGLGLAYFANNQRVEALDMMMNLRKLGKDELASRLEQAIRQNRRVSLTPEELQESQEELTKTSGNKSGIKVRLRGKLQDI